MNGAKFKEVIKIIGITLLLAVIVVSVCASVIVATDVYVLVFLGITFSVLLYYLSQAFGRFTRLPYGANLAIVVIAMVGVMIGVLLLAGYQIQQQVQKASQQFDASYAQLQRELDRHPILIHAVSRIPYARELFPEQTKGVVPSDAQKSTKNTDEAAMKTSDESDGAMSQGALKAVSGRVVGVLGNVFATTFGATVNIAFVFFAGLFFAVKPHFYRETFTLLFPQSVRPRVNDILNQLGVTLRRWMQGRALVMTITGVGTAIVLWGLGVPLAGTLGGITAVLTFIPNIGPLLALLLSALVALSQGPTTAGWVVLLYILFQLLESNVITPLIQEHQTIVPAAWLLTAQLLLGVLVGFLGVLIATPLVACLIVIVRETYVVDVLGDHT